MWGEGPKWSAGVGWVRDTPTESFSTCCKRYISKRPKRKARNVAKLKLAKQHSADTFRSLRCLSSSSDEPSSLEIPNALLGLDNDRPIARDHTRLPSNNLPQHHARDISQSIRSARHLDELVLVSAKSESTSVSRPSETARSQTHPTPSTQLTIAAVPEPNISSRVPFSDALTI